MFGRNENVNEVEGTASVGDSWGWIQVEDTDDEMPVRAVARHEIVEIGATTDGKVRARLRGEKGWVTLTDPEALHVGFICTAAREAAEACTDPAEAPAA